MLRNAGVDLDDESLLKLPGQGKSGVMAVVGKAGSGKTLLLAELYKALADSGVNIVSGDFESRKSRDKRSLAILAPTNKAASVLRLRGVPATTIHRVLYTPVYDPEYERIAEWLAGNDERPEIEGLTDDALDRAAAFYQNNKSIPAPWRPQVCGVRTLSPGGNAEMSRWISGLSTKPRCWMTGNSKTCRRFFQRFLCSVIRLSWRRSISPDQWCLTGCPNRES